MGPWIKSALHGSLALPKSRDRFALLIFAVGIGYFGIAKLGLYLATINSAVSPVWPATGFAISMIYLLGWRAWPAVAIGALGANLLTEVSVLGCFAIALGNTFEALVGAILLRKIQTYRKYLEHLTDTLAVVVAVLLASVVSATVGTGTLFLSGTINQQLLYDIFSTWWIGDVLGGLVVVPLFILMKRPSQYSEDWFAALGVISFTTAMLYVVFFTDSGGAYLFLLFPALLYGVRAIGDSSTFAISAAICATSVVATLAAYGPFSAGDINERLTHLQLFLAAIAITALMLAGLGKERLTKVPSFVLLLCWVMAGGIFYSFEKAEVKQTANRFSSIVKEAHKHMQFTMRAYEEALLGAAGLLVASDKVNPEDWREFNDLLRITHRHPGMNGIGLVLPVPSSELDEFESSMWTSGMPDFEIKPVPGYSLNEDEPNHTNYIVKYIEPLEANSKSRGLDMGSEPSRRAAAELARDSGLATVSSMVALVQDKLKSPAFLYFLPIYSKGAPRSTLDDRIKAHRGWVYGPFMYKNFFEEILSKVGHEVELQAFEEDDLATSLAQKSILFSNFSDKAKGATLFGLENQRNKSILAKKIKLGQRSYILEWRKSPGFVTSHNSVVAWVGLCGALGSLLLTNILVGLQTVNQRVKILANDLTKELSESREKFREGERRLLYALEGSNDGIWDWHIENSEMYVSGKIAENFGWRQLLIVKSVEDMAALAHPDAFEEITASLKRHLLGESIGHEVEARYRTKEGEWRWLLTRGKISERDQQGHPTRLTGVHIDIDALKNAQNKLEETQYHLRNIANSVPSLVALWSKNLVCEFANEAYARWYGLDVDSIVGMKMKDILSPEIYNNRRDSPDAALRGEQVGYEREIIRERDGERRYVIVTYMPNLTKGEPDGFFLFIQDITELKNAELTAIAERKAAVQATNIKSQFLANMSHEIRTPINGIIGMSNLVLNSDLETKQLEYANIVSQSSKALLNIINDILDFSKVEAGKLELDIVNFDLRDLVSEVKQTFSFLAAEKGVDLVLDSEINENHFFLGDPGRIRQILTNLVGNAIKFTNEGLVTMTIKTQVGKTSTKLDFKISDTGVGIPEADLNKMFVAFSQADATMSRRFGGTGLGLSICKQLVRLMGGEIGVESIENKGSTFWFQLTLPHGLAQEGHLKSKNLPVKYTQGARILVAEDNRLSQNVVLEALQSLGYLAHGVANGQEVLDACREGSYDLILMDCQMPEMDGYEATQAIRNSHSSELKNVPIVAMAGKEFKGDREKCLAAGMNDYVTKPLDEGELSVVIEANLSRVRSEPAPSIRDRVKHLLVVEDNPVNQKVVCVNLELLGYTYDLAVNG